MWGAGQGRGGGVGRVIPEGIRLSPWIIVEEDGNMGTERYH